MRSGSRGTLFTRSFHVPPKLRVNHLWRNSHAQAPSPLFPLISSDANARLASLRDEFVEEKDRHLGIVTSRIGTIIDQIRFVRQNVEPERVLASRASRDENKCRVTARRFVRISVRLSRLRVLPKRTGSWRSNRAETERQCRSISREVRRWPIYLSKSR